ncbi:MAG: hypothetical protein INQ03_22175 [Candidatus Heimdallarchaeota archaeon]|nr:hypothetical protein [Candidatus Heimdallarchaeota archaeon]
MWVSDTSAKELLEEAVEIISWEGEPKFWFKVAAFSVFWSQISMGITIGAITGSAELMRKFLTYLKRF